MSNVNFQEPDQLLQLKQDFNKFRASRVSKKESYSLSLKKRAVIAIENHSFKSIVDACRISLSTLYNWRSEFEAPIKSSLPPRKLTVIEDQLNPQSPKIISIKINPELILICPSGLEVRGHISIISDLIVRFGGLNEYINKY